MTSASRFARLVPLGLMVGAVVCVVMFTRCKRGDDGERALLLPSPSVTNREELVRQERINATLDVPSQWRERGHGAPTLVGVGIMLTRGRDDDGILQIVQVVPGSSADLAGLKVPLVIHAIDGMDVEGMSLSDCAGMVRGVAGTKVRLQLSHSQEGEKFSVELVRQPLKL